MSETPLERLIRSIDPADDDQAKVSTFARGLVIGALVGAAIAGSTIWQRRRQGAKPRPPAQDRPTSRDVRDR